MIDFRKLLYNNELFYPVTDAKAVIYDKGDRISVYDAINSVYGKTIEKVVTFFGPESGVIVETISNFNRRELDYDKYVEYWKDNEHIAWAPTIAGENPEITKLITAVLINEGGWVIYYNDASLEQFKSFNSLIEVANGKTKSMVFATESAMRAFLKAQPTDENKLNIGDVLFIRATDVPDYWITEVKSTPDAEGYYYGFSELETQKVDLSGYYTKLETDNLLLQKSSIININDYMYEGANLPLNALYHYNNLVVESRVVNESGDSVLVFVLERGDINYDNENGKLKRIAVFDYNTARTSLSYQGVYQASNIPEDYIAAFNELEVNENRAGLMSKDDKVTLINHGASINTLSTNLSNLANVVNTKANVIDLQLYFTQRERIPVPIYGLDKLPLYVYDDLPINLAVTPADPDDDLNDFYYVGRYTTNDGLTYGYFSFSNKGDIIGLFTETTVPEDIKRALCFGYTTEVVTNIFE